MNDGRIRELSLTVESRILPIFFSILQDGFLIEAQLGCSIREFLRKRCQLAHDTIANRISTVFLDGKPVDDLDSVFIKENCTLALSGAMPGLVGAVMRSNSPLRSFRNSITHGGDERSEQQLQDGLIRLKLFNTVMSELAPSFLRKGILLPPHAMKDLFFRLPDDNRGGLREAFLDRERVPIDLLQDEEFLSESNLVSFSVSTEE